MKIKLSALAKRRLVVLVHLPGLFLFGFITRGIQQKLDGLEMLLAVGSMILVFTIIYTISIVICIMRIAPLE